jgi:putative transposase
MGDEPDAVCERGLLSVSEQVWAQTVRRAEVIGRLAENVVVRHEAADAAAAELEVSRRQVYELLGRWRAGEGVVTDLLPRRSSGGRGREELPGEVEAVIREVLRTRYLTKQRFNPPRRGGRHEAHNSGGDGAGGGVAACRMRPLR